MSPSNTAHAASILACCILSTFFQLQFSAWNSKFELIGSKSSTQPENKNTLLVYEHAQKQ